MKGRLETELKILRTTCYNRLHQNQNKGKILFPYNFNFHFILLEIKLERGVVSVLDSRRKDPQDYADMTAMLQKVGKSSPE